MYNTTFLFSKTFVTFHTSSSSSICNILCPHQVLLQVPTYISEHNGERSFFAMVVFQTCQKQTLNYAENDAGVSFLRKTRI